MKEAENLQQLLVFVQQKTEEEMHTSRIELKNLKEYHLQLQQVCNVCVCMCVCEQMCMYSECMQTMLTSSIASQCDWKKWPSTISQTSRPLPRCHFSFLLFQKFPWERKPPTWPCDILKIEDFNLFSISHFLPCETRLESWQILWRWPPLIRDWTECVLSDVESFCSEQYTQSRFQSCSAS